MVIINNDKIELIERSFTIFEKVLNNKEKSKDVKTKFKNINGKTGQYNVPSDLFQQRTHRANRTLIEWKTVKNNSLTIDDLSLFEGDVVVAFINNDYFDKAPSGSLFSELKKRLGSDEKVSSMILLKSEGGNPSSQVQREAYQKLIKEFPNHQNDLIRRDSDEKYQGKGNHVFKGFIYYDIRGGQKDKIYSHEKLDKPNLFNPAVEYASTNTCLDIDLTLHYFALKSIPPDKREAEYNQLVNCFEAMLDRIKFPNISGEKNYTIPFNLKKYIWRILQ